MPTCTMPVSLRPAVAGGNAENVRHLRNRRLIRPRGSHQLELGQVLGIHQSDGFLARVDHDQVVDIAIIEDA